MSTDTKADTKADTRKEKADLDRDMWELQDLFRDIIGTLSTKRTINN